MGEVIVGGFQTECLELEEVWTLVGTRIGSKSMRILSWIGVGLTAGLATSLAQEPRLWYDPDQGCTYILSPQGGVGLRYRSDGSPDCRGVPTGPTMTPPASPEIPNAASRRTVQSFDCQIAEIEQGHRGPRTVKVSIDPDAKAILIEASERGTQRYTLDTDWSTWFNGRSERDPRLGIVLSPHDGSMWLDMAVWTGSTRFEAKAHKFQCRIDARQTAPAR